MHAPCWCYLTLALPSTQSTIALNTMLASKARLRVITRSNVKVLLLAYKTLYGLAASYLKDLTLLLNILLGAPPVFRAGLSIPKVKDISRTQIVSYRAPICGLPPGIREADC